MFTIDSSSTTPPFEQLREQLIGLIRSGELAPGAKLPPVRKLAVEWRVGLDGSASPRSW